MSEWREKYELLVAQVVEAAQSEERARHAPFPVSSELSIGGATSDLWALVGQECDDLVAASECLLMVAETIESLGGGKAESIAPMFLPEALRGTVYLWCKRALRGELEEVGEKIRVKTELTPPVERIPK